MSIRLYRRKGGEGKVKSEKEREVEVEVDAHVRRWPTIPMDDCPYWEE
jgi:hypothetical protein